MLWEQALQVGLPVFPLNADKKPTCPHGFKDAELEKTKIYDLFRQYPGELIGVPTGSVSGIDVLDADITKHQAAKEFIISTKIPTTRVHQTRSGGRHYIFKHKSGIRNWTARPVLGIDGRGDGGYIVWWPSHGFSIFDQPLVEWPSELVTQFAKPSQQSQPRKPIPRITEPRLESLIRRVATAVNGQRNDLLFWAACRVGEWIERGQVTREAGESVLLQAARYAGLPDSESIATINSGLSRT